MLTYIKSFILLKEEVGYPNAQRLEVKSFVNMIDNEKGGTGVKGMNGWLGGVQRQGTEN